MIACAGSNYIFNAIIILVEIDIPILTVSYPESYTNSLVNMNQLLTFTLQLAENQDPDFLDLSVAIVYNYDVMKTIKFNSITFSCRIWDAFSTLGSSN